jgi:hypothetical protein
LSGVNLGGAVRAVDLDDRVVGALGEAVDADLANGAAQGLNQVGAQVGAERPGELRAVAEEAKGKLKGVLMSDPDWQASVAAGLLEQDDVVVLAGVGDAADIADPHVEKVSVGGGWHGVVLLRAPARATWLVSPMLPAPGLGEGEAVPGGRRGAAGPEGGRRPPAGPALRIEEKVVTTGDRSADCLGVSTPSCQGRQRWDFGDLVLVQMLPEDAWWPMRLSAPDGLIRGGDEVHTEVVDGLGQRLVHHLERVDRGSQDRVRANHASLDEEGDLEIRESSAFADASALAVYSPRGKVARIPREWSPVGRASVRHPQLVAAPAGS